jgi:putative ABC transport system permease protein
MVSRGGNFFRITLREIGSSPGRFVSIFLIVLLGSGFFAGMRATCPDMKRSCDAWLDESRCEDLSVVSILGFTHSEIEALSRLPSVEKVEGAYRSDAIFRREGSSASDPGTAVALLSLSNSPAGEGIDEPHLFEGRLPSGSGECLAEIGQAGRRSAKVGERITLEGPWEGQGGSGWRSFIVTGIAQSPLYISYERGTNSLGSGTTAAYFLLPEEDARELALPKIPWMKGIATGSFYTEARIIVKGARRLDSFDPAYKSLVEDSKRELRAFAEKKLGSDKYWLISDRSSNAGVSGFSSDAERVGKLGEVFPLVFFLVAALVSLTAMTRLVEEKRGEIGTLKALGYRPSSILAQYLAYAAAATLGGGAIGVLLGMRFLPALIYSMYRLMYYVGPLDSSFDPLLGSEAVLLAFACTGGATVLAGAREMLATPASLMRPRSPEPGKRVLLERITFVWKRLGFLGKVTARNIFRYKRRFWMSVVGVAGCTGLLVAGFGMNDSLAALTKKQFGEIYHYDALCFTVGTAAGEAKALAGLRSLPGIASADAFSLQGCTLSSLRKGTRAAKLDAFLAVPMESKTLSRYVTFRDGGSSFALPEEGLVLTRKASELLGLRAGDRIDVELEGKRAEFEIAAVTDHYVLHFAYLSPAAFEAGFGVRPSFNALFCLETPRDRAAFEAGLGRAILAVPGIVRVSFTSADTKLWENIMGNMRYIIAVIIVAAGLLTLVVIYTLTSINVTERKRELATIKVLGFRKAEVVAYVYRENAALSLIGTALGLVFGVFLHRAVVLTTEVDACMFGRTVYPASLAYAALLSLGFAALANLLMNRSLNSIDMVEATKSAE